MTATLLSYGERPRPTATPAAALAWTALHAPLFIALYVEPIRAAALATPEAWRAWLWPTFVPQAGLLALLAWLVALPLSRWPRLYRFAAPAVAALATIVIALDSRVFGALGYHLNGFFLRLMMQSGALREAGVPLSDVLLFGAVAAACAALDVWGAGLFFRRATWPRRARYWALGLLLLAGAERVYGGFLVHYGGPAFFAASTVLPLQIPIRMAALVARITGEPKADPLAGAKSARVPAGVPPAEMRFERRPDVLFLVAESFPADHLDAKTTPNLWRRTLEGARFEHHYSGASNTEFGIFSLLYGLQAAKLEATLGAGRQSPVFPVFRANGYRLRVLASSCVDWMGLKETVFGNVQDELETWCKGHAPEKSDVDLLDSARRFVDAGPDDQPVFMFMFFFGTHFNYFRDAEDVVFTPEWDGSGGLKASTEPGWRIENRARNAAHALDRRLESFLTWFERRRGRPPLVVFTGDHGEEFRQKGHIGHGSQVTREQIHVPAIWFGPGVPVGTFPAPTSHADVLPTLLALLGDRHPPALYSDGMSAFEAPSDRFVVSTVGWEPSYAVIGLDVKVRMYAGLGTASVTDLDDKPLADGDARLAKHASGILRAMRGEPEPAAARPGPPTA
ncbi:MAG: sulfatase-like hydrolase/transferase, partial [Anaeromyxobacteraceae bacterium]